MAEILPVPIKEILIEATFAPNRAIRKDVLSIDLGALGIEAERLYNKGKIDGKEHVNPTLVTSDRRLLLAIKDTDGDSEGGLVTLAIRRFGPLDWPKDLRQDRFVGVLIHNHTDRLPTSTTDLRRLFLANSEIFAATATFVANTDTKTVIFRGPKTPEYSDKESKEKVKEWDLAIERIMLARIISGVTFGSILDLNRIAQLDFIRTFSRSNDLRIFTCPLRENIASIQNP